MRIILKSLDSLKNLLKIITSHNRQALNDWFYNASDSELKQSIVLLNSKECLDAYPRHLLVKYIKFAQLMLSGDLPQPPSDQDLTAAPTVNYYNNAKGCYTLYSILKFLTTYKLQMIFKKLAIHSLTKCNFSQVKLTRPLASMSRILMSRVFSMFKIAFTALSGLIYPHRHKKFRTKVQNMKMMLRCVREMIIKGKVNLEQRAFWTWVVVLDEWKYGKVSGLKDDFSLLRSVGHSANLRYFHCLKDGFEQWKSATPMTIHSLLSTSPDINIRPSSKSHIKRHFKKKLAKKFEVLVSCIYTQLESSFLSIQQYATYQHSVFQHQFHLASLKPHIRNLAHIHRKLLKDSIAIWKSGQYEYEYEETVVTILNERKNFANFAKPIVLLEFHEGSKVNRLLIKNLNHILLRKIRTYWNIWNRTEKEMFNLFGDDTLDLSIFKLNGIKCEKLKLVMTELLSVNEKRKNLGKAVLHLWMQKANFKDLVDVRMKNIISKISATRVVKKIVFDEFQRNPSNKKEFTDTT